MKNRKKASAAASALFLALFSLLFTACAPPEPDGSYYTFTDAAGYSVRLGEKPETVVSLLGSFAEVWLLAGGEIRGITEDVVTEGRFPVTDDMTVVGSVKTPNMEKVLSLSPDFVLLSTDIAGHVTAAATLKAAGIPCAFFHVEKIEEYLSMLKICTDMTGRTDLYGTNGEAVAAQAAEVIDEVKDLPEKPRVLFLRVYSTGAKAKADQNIVTNILDDFKVENIARKRPSLLQDLSDEVVIKEDPDVILATSMGDEEQALATFQALLSRPGWSKISAVESGKCVMLPKNLFHYKPNAKWGESYAHLKEVLFP